MLCAIYKSPKKFGAYLYIEKKGKFDRIPSMLFSSFGQPQFVMLFNLASKKKLINADKQEVKQKILEQGFYLQLAKQDDGLFNSLSEIK
ncbi:YcgL domain-containing protein [Rodentibacter caecimuris]|uniref:YcgL domain-containing protein BKG89_06410 n=1 Tax=Rodentibacter caecimuris TaxID=1796644 RepID=A0ABX3L0M3_9PAST|nr:hypothetical protein BKG89_06410 [Rodentibacter heylii]